MASPCAIYDGGMGKVGVIVKAATGIVAATTTVVTLLKDNPQLTEGFSSTVDKIKSATNSDNPKLRFDGRIQAIDTCADAVAANFPELTEPAEWRRKASTLRVRGELAWNANQGKARKKAMAELNAETAVVLEEVNARLAQLTTTDTEPPVIDTAS